MIDIIATAVFDLCQNTGRAHPYAGIAPGTGGRVDDGDNREYGPLCIGIHRLQLGQCGRCGPHVIARWQGHQPPPYPRLPPPR